MLNETVRHIRYGVGKVVNAEAGHISVVFDREEETKQFCYPDAFDRYLCFEDPELQKEAESALEAARRKRKEEEAVRMFRYRMYEAKRKKEQSELLKRRRKAARI